MRLSLVVLSAVLLAGPVSFAGGKSAHKKYASECRQENPGASKSEVKKCVKGKAEAAKAK